MRIGNRDFDVKNRTYIMGILNVTPDSFSDGGKWNQIDRALEHACAMAQEGADIIDVGGESTRPGHQQISDEEEIARIVPVIQRVKSELDIPVSVDTYKSKVAAAAIEAGADLVNDIWGLKYDQEMAGLIASFTVKAEPGLVYSFKVTAVNKGGESFPSEILSAYKAKRSKGTVLIVNAFHRTSGPESMNNLMMQGFDIQSDPGLPYISTTAFCGYQQNFNRTKAGIETEDGLGYSGNELEGMQIAGNTFDYPFVHGKAIQTAGRYSFVSCSSETVESGSTDLSPYYMVDIIYGAENSTLSNRMQQTLTNYCRGGGKLFISGSYIGNKLGDTNFTANVLKYTYGGSMKHVRSGEIFGTNIRFQIPRGANEQTYAVPAPDCILPAEQAFPVFCYTEGNQCAGVAYKGAYRTFVLGFPFESIVKTDQRTHIMKAMLHFFEEK